MREAKEGWGFRGGAREVYISDTMFGMSNCLPGMRKRENKEEQTKEFPKYYDKVSKLAYKPSLLLSNSTQCARAREKDRKTHLY